MSLLGFLVLLVQAVRAASLDKIRRPEMTGVVHLLPGNRVKMVGPGSKVVFGCELLYSQFNSNQSSMEYWWERDGRTIWHSVGGYQRRDDLQFSVDDLMSWNRSLMLTISPTTAADHGKYSCVFGDTLVRNTTYVCTGKQRTAEMVFMCKSRLTKRITILQHPDAVPVPLKSDEPATLSCKLQPRSKYFRNDKFTRFLWSIGDSVYLWVSGKGEETVLPGTSFSFDVQLQVWNMTVTNSSILIGRMPKCEVRYGKSRFVHSFAVITAPKPMWVMDHLPTSGYFGIILIILMIWMLLALNKTA